MLACSLTTDGVSFRTISTVVRDLPEAGVLCAFSFVAHAACKRTTAAKTAVNVPRHLAIEINLIGVNRGNQVKKRKI